MPAPKKKLPKKHRLSGYFDQMEVFELKLFIKKNPEVSSMSDLIRKSVFAYKNSDNSSLDMEKIVKLIKSQNVDWDNYEKRKEETKKEDTQVSEHELDRRAVLREMKGIFKKGEKLTEILEKAPKEELDRIKRERENRVKERLG